MHVCGFVCVCVCLSFCLFVRRVLFSCDAWNTEEGPPFCVRICRTTLSPFLRFPFLFSLFFLHCFCELKKVRDAMVVFFSFSGSTSGIIFSLCDFVVLDAVRHLDRSEIKEQESSTTTTPAPTVGMGNPSLTFVRPLFQGNNVALRQNHRRIETRIFPFESLVRQNTPVAFRTYARNDDCTLFQHPSTEITQNACSIHHPSSVVPETGPFGPLDVFSSLGMVSDPLECSSMISNSYSKDLLSHPSSGMEQPLQPGESDVVEYVQLHLETQNPPDVVTIGPSNSGIDGSVLPSPPFLGDTTTQLFSNGSSIDSRATSVTTSENGPLSTPDSLYLNENSTSDDFDYGEKVSLFFLLSRRRISVSLSFSCFEEIYRGKKIAGEFQASPKLIKRAHSFPIYLFFPLLSFFFLR